MFERLRNTNSAPRTSESALNESAREKPFREGDVLENGGVGAEEEEGWRDPWGPAPGVKAWFKMFWGDLVGFVYPE